MPTNIAELFTAHLRDPRRALYRHHVPEGWRDVTVAEVACEIQRWQAAFRRAGIARGERIALCARNGVAWVAIDLAALGMGLVVVPLYVDDNAESAAWCAAHAEARLLVVDSSRIAASLSKVKGIALPPIVVLSPDEGEPAMAADAFLPAAGDGGIAVDALAADALATICFTSGTSGRPKGVMLSHGNILANVDQCRQTGMAHSDDNFLSILPLSHMFERTGGYYLPLAIGAKVTYCRGIAHIAEDLVSQAPTAMFAVPRIFERFRARIDESLAASPLKRRLFDACVARGYRAASREGSLADRLLAPMLRALVAKPVLGRLGGRMRLVVVGGAALDPVLAHTFIGLGLPMLQGYGMTEASPVISVNRDDDNVPESVGPPLPGVDIRLAEGGELLARGANVMLGYWRNPEASRAALEDGWLHTGDVAAIEGGKVYIRGRAKDIVVLSNGEKLPPQDVEFAILHDPLFEQVMLIGEGRPYPILLAVTRERDEKALEKRANELLKAFPRWMRVRRVVAVAEPWSVENGLLTPTLKLKRPMLQKRYEREIEAAYREVAA
ncbi:MAG TPA: AMP-binding protein [Casimicrobiaceae bacterium]|nr:AMP-binding protein [Casimicrobiaceae bacterium]